MTVFSYCNVDSFMSGDAAGSVPGGRVGLLPSGLPPISPTPSADQRAEQNRAGPYVSQSNDHRIPARCRDRSTEPSARHQSKKLPTRAFR